MLQQLMKVIEINLLKTGYSSRVQTVEKKHDSLQ